MKSIGQKVMQLSGLLGTEDLTPWEEEFVDSINDRTKAGKETAGLSEKQVEIVERIWKKNFA